MPFQFQIGFWDIMLIIMVTLLGTGMAYIHHPKWKAAFLLMPIPFTLAVLSLGKPIGIQPVVGLLVLLLYTHAVRVLHQQWRVPIFLAIALSVALYCTLSLLLSRVVPTSEPAFWTACVGVVALGVLLHKFQPHRHEPGHRTPLPVVVKLPLTTLVVSSLVLIKPLLQGFIAAFPMVGIFAAYESRHSLWTNTKQIPINLMTMTPMIATIHVLQPIVGIGWALAAGWVVLFVLLIPLTRDIWTSPLTAENDVSQSQIIHSYTT